MHLGQNRKDCLTLNLLEYGRGLGSRGETSVNLPPRPQTRGPLNFKLSTRKCQRTSAGIKPRSAIANRRRFQGRPLSACSLCRTVSSPLERKNLRTAGPTLPNGAKFKLRPLTGSRRRHRFRARICHGKGGRITQRYLPLLESHSSCFHSAVSGTTPRNIWHASR